MHYPRPWNCITGELPKRSFVLSYCRLFNDVSLLEAFVRQQYDGVSALVTQIYHLVPGTNCTVHPSPWVCHPQNYDLKQTYFRNSQKVFKHSVARLAIRIQEVA